MRLEEEEQKLGFYTTAFVEAQDREDAELKAMDLLRNDQKLVARTRNAKSDSPMMFVETIEELETFKGRTLPRTGFAFFPADKEGDES